MSEKLKTRLEMATEGKVIDFATKKPFEKIDGRKPVEFPEELTKLGTYCGLLPPSHNAKLKQMGQTVEGTARQIDRQIEMFQALKQAYGEACQESLQLINPVMAMQHKGRLLYVTPEGHMWLVPEENFEAFMKAQGVRKPVLEDEEAKEEQ